MRCPLVSLRWEGATALPQAVQGPRTRGSYPGSACQADTASSSVLVREFASQALLAAPEGTEFLRCPAHGGGVSRDRRWCAVRLRRCPLNLEQLSSPFLTDSKVPGGSACP